LSVNVAANLMNQVSGALFPLITFPYVSRVLRPEGLGRLSFAEAVVYYFSLLAALGIPWYGVRESARHRDDKTALATLAAELFLLNALMTAVALIAFAVFMVLSPKARTDPLLFWIFAVPMLMAPLGFSWLFDGLEEYVYIAVRTLSLRVLVVLAVFLCVHTQEDLHRYALIAILNTAGPSVLNACFVRKYLSVRNMDWKRLNVGKHLKPALIVFGLSSVMSLHPSLSQVMLGYLTSDTEVGFYSAADRVVRVVVTLVTSAGVVVLPRACYYIGCEKLGEYGRLATTTSRFISFIGFPAAVGLMVSARPFLILLSGSAFEPAIPLLQIMGLTVILKALSLVGYQVLYAQGKEKLLLSSVVLGVCVNFLLSSFLIPRWRAVGAAWSMLSAEACITTIQMFRSGTSSHFAWPIRSMCKYGGIALSMAVIVLFLRSFATRSAFGFLLSLGAGMAFYLTVLWLLKDSMLSAIWSRLTTGVTAGPKATGAEI
jgi:O-antigen/teichoic acid export membrane protein